MNRKKYNIQFRKTGFLRYELKTSLFLPVERSKAFGFFEDPANLFEITPGWLDFRMLDASRNKVYEGAEFDYTIRWLATTFQWRSRIINYNPPSSFTDIQVAGPYRRWEHLHEFEEFVGGTLMKDSVIYVLPLAALLIHRIIIMPQLRHIFMYRAERIEEWMRGTMIRKGNAMNTG